MKTWTTQIFRGLTNGRYWAYGLFWSWNIIFLAFMTLGFAPLLLPEISIAVRLGQIPLAFLIYGVVITLIPALSIILGATLFRRSPERLFILGYGVEGPLMLLLLLRFFIVREMTPALTLLLLISALAMGTLLWRLLDSTIHKRAASLRYLHLAGLSLLLGTGLYAALWLAFYAIPLGVIGAEFLWEIVCNLPEFLNDLWFNTMNTIRYELAWLPFRLLGILLGFYTATLFILMPVAVFVLYLRAWWQGVKMFSEKESRIYAVALTIGVLIVSLMGIVLANQQPQHVAFALLQIPPATITEAQELLTQQKALRAGLLNAYLAPFRYISAVGEVEHIRIIYADILSLTSEQAARVQQFYESIARPLLYDPVTPVSEEASTYSGSREPCSLEQCSGEPSALRQESQTAAELYEKFFDKPLIDGERDKVVRAVRSTWAVDQAEAAWQAVDDREIHLTHQEVTITEHGDWANIEIYEAYENQTGQRQEVVYYFNLPESAVVTGVWLGNTPNRAERFAYRVAPRGAAQAVYRNEVRYNRDPALLEQIGPRQYRLRIFPVEPPLVSWDSRSNHTQIGETPALYMWVTYRVLAQDGAWPLPHLADLRNIYWDRHSVRLLNGEPMNVDADAWLPESVPAQGNVIPQVRRIDFPNGNSVLVSPASTNSPAFPANLHLAVVVDRSRSMAEYAGNVKTTLDRLATLSSNVDVYLTASEYRGEAPSRSPLAQFDPTGLVYYGGQNAAELLAQFDQLHAGEVYDAILVLTDGTGYKLNSDNLKVPIPDAPVWMLHLDGALSLGYDDATLEAIQASGGGVVGALEDALVRIAVGNAAGTGETAFSDLIDGYEWTTLPTTEITTEAGVQLPPTDPFAAFAARRLILAEMYRQRDTLDQLSNLDYLHALALEHSIVTPYSSMIVLINTQQEKLLDELEAAEDRFLREHEDVGETVSDPISVTGVPEPEEWLLIIMATGLLAWYTLRKRYAKL